MNSRLNKTNRSIAVKIEKAYDFEKGRELPVYAGHAYDLVICRDGVMAKEVGTQFNLFRFWKESNYWTNVTSSTRFDLENDKMSQADFAANVAKLTPAEFQAWMNSDAKGPKGRVA